MKKDFEKCKKCGKALNDDMSKLRGYGPECWKSVDKITVRVIGMKNEHGRYGDGYTEGFSERITSLESSQYSDEILVFADFTCREVLATSPDFIFLVYVRKDLVNAEWVTRYPDGCNVLNLVKAEYVPVAKISTWDDEILRPDGLIGKLDSLTKKNEFVVPVEWTEDAMTDVLIDFKHTKYEIEYVDVAASRFVDGFDEHLLHWADYSIDELAEEFAYGWLRQMQGEDYETLPSELPINRKQFPASADNLIAWYGVVLESFNGKDSLYASGELPKVMVQVMDSVLDELSCIIGFNGRDEWGVDYAADLFDDWHSENLWYEVKNQLNDHLSTWAGTD